MAAIREKSNADLTADSSMFLSAITALNVKYDGIDVSGNVTLSKAYIDASLLLYSTNVSTNLAFKPFATNASVGLALGAYTTNASINTAAFAKNASFGLYATNSSIGIYTLRADASIVALQTADKTFATNASVGTNMQKKLTIVDTSMYWTGPDTSIWSWKVTKV
jgi:hypothetical protein